MNNQGTAYDEIIAKCRADETFKQRLLADPAGTLRLEGIEVPPGVEVRVFENTERQRYLVIPIKPELLSDEQIGRIAAGCYTQWGCSR
jgi:hypothetical protein